MLTLFRGGGVHGRDQLVNDLSRVVADVTIRQVSSAAANMNAAELRGYVRTKAMSEARSHIGRAVADGRCAVAEATDLTAAVLERVVHLVARGIAAPPVVATPTPHVSVRKAA